VILVAGGVLAESWWDHVDAVARSPERTVAAREVLAPDLLAAITAALAVDPVVKTISDAKENLVHEGHARWRVGGDGEVPCAWTSAPTR
jgi:hypothetical protein